MLSHLKIKSVYVAGPRAVLVGGAGATGRLAYISTQKVGVGVTNTYSQSVLS